MGRRGRRLGGMLVLVCLVGAAGELTRAWLGTRDATEETVAELEATRDDLAAVREDLELALDDLADARAALSDDLATRDGRRHARDAAQADLDEARWLLGEAQGRLAAAQLSLLASSAGLDAFGHCLRGVSEALNQASVGDVSGLRATIGRVEGACREAGASL